MNKNKIILGTKSGNLESKILEEKLVETKIGLAKTNWDEIPLAKELDTIYKSSRDLFNIPCDSSYTIIFSDVLNLSDVYYLCI